MRRSLLFRGPPLVALLAAALILGLGAWQIVRARQTVLHDAEANARNLTRSLAQQAARTVETVDLVLSGTVNRIEGGAMADPAQFKRFLEWRLTTIPQVRDVVVVDANGDWVADSIPQGHAPINTGDRAYFAWHRDHAERGLHVETPIVSRVSDKVFIPLSRRWNKPDGSFGGVVRAALRPEFFQDFYEGLGVGAEGAITLMSTSGRVLARQPAREGTVDRDLSNSPLFRERLPRARAGTYRSHSPIDGIERIAAYERVEDLPLVAFVGLGLSETLTPWRDESFVEAAMLMLAACGLIGLGIKLAGQQRRAQAAEAVIRENEARYRLLAENTSDIIMLESAEGERSYVSPACLPMLGYTAEEFSRIATVEVVHPEDLDRVMTIYRSLGAAQPQAKSRHRLRHREGRWLWVEAVFTHVERDGGAVVLSAIRDVDERHRQAIERARAVIALDRMQQALVMLDAEQRVLLFNTRAPELLDLPEAVLHPGAAFADIRQFQRGRGDFALVEQRINARVAGSDLRQLPPAYDWPRPDGSTLEVRGARLADGGFVYTFTDVTERKAAEAIAAETEARYREVLEASHDAILGQLAEGVIVADREGRLTLVNEAAERIHGVKMLGVAPDAYTETYHLLTEAGEPYPAHDLALSRAVLRGETTVDTRWRILRPDGSEVLAIGTAKPVIDRTGTQIGAVLTVRDDTKRNEAEQALRKSEEHLRHTVELNPQVPWTCDPAGNITSYSNRWLEMTGQAPGEPLGSGWAAALHPDDLPATITAFAACLVSGEPVDVDYRIRMAATGAYRWMRARAHPRRDEAGDILSWYGVVEDIHDRKLAEAELRDLNETLGNRIVAALAEREQAEAALRQAQKMEAVGQLTGGIAHDFNNLLAVVVGSLDILGRRLGQDATGARRHLDTAEGAARRAALLTQRLLAFSRQQPLQPASVDTNALLAGLSELLRLSLGDEISLETRLGENLWRVHADPNQLENTILNLALNARDAMPEGGRLVIETRNRRGYQADEGSDAETSPVDHVSIAVVDTGSGMSAEVVAKAFEPFFTTKPVGHGSGLGLSQVYGFVQQSGGRVELDSQVGRGTAVHIHLPRYGSSAVGPP